MTFPTLPEPSAGPDRPAAPAPLVVAAGLTMVQGLLVVGGGVLELRALDGERLVLGLSTAVFFLLAGTALLLCAWGLRGVRPWARGPVLMAQLVWLGLAWNFRDSASVSLGLVVAATVVLAGLLHPRSMLAIETARDE